MSVIEDQEKTCPIPRPIASPTIRAARITTPRCSSATSACAFSGVEKTNVEEYCVSEGWVRVPAGKAKDRYGNPLTIKLTGKVEPYFKDEKS